MEFLGKVLEALLDKLVEHLGSSGEEHLAGVLGDYLAKHPMLLGISLLILVLCGTGYVVHRVIRKFRHK